MADSSRLKMNVKEKLIAQAEIDIRLQVIDCRADPLQVSGHEFIIDVFSKLVRHPFMLSLLACEIKRRSGIVVEGCFLLILNDCVVTVDSNQPMVMRNGKGKGLSPFRASRLCRVRRHISRQPPPMQILSISNVKSHDAALNLAG